MSEFCLQLVTDVIKVFTALTGYIFPLIFAFLLHLLQLFLFLVVFLVACEQLAMMGHLAFCLLFFSRRLKRGKFFKEGSMLKFASIDLFECSVDIDKLFFLVLGSEKFSFNDSFSFPLLLELIKLVEDGLPLLKQSFQFLMHVFKVRNR